MESTVADITFECMYRSVGDGLSQVVTAAEVGDKP
jgi:hypothetical protein